MSDLKTISILFKTYEYVLKNAKMSLKEVDLNFNEFMLLEALYHKGELRTTELAEAILVPSSSLTYNLQNLKARHLIVTVQDEKDRRNHYVQLSPEGRVFFEPVYTQHQKAMRSFLDMLTEEEELSLQSHLKKLGYEAERIYKHEISISKRKE